MLSGLNELLNIQNNGYIIKSPIAVTMMYIHALEKIAREFIPIPPNFRNESIFSLSRK